MGAMLAVMLVVAVVVALLVGLVAWGRALTRRYNEAWATAAAQIGGRFEPKHGPWYNRRRRIEARVDDHDVVVDHYTESNGQTSVTYTRFRVGVDFAGDLELKVYPTNVFSRLGAVLGLQDVKSGDEAFDEAFTVKTNDEVRARTWLADPEVRHAIRRSNGYHFALADGQLVAKSAVFEQEPERIAQIAGEVVEVARRGRALREFWTREVAARDGVVEEERPGRLRIAVDEASVPLRIDTRGDGGATRIVARRRSAKGERFALRWDGGLEVESSDDELTRRRLSPGVERSLQRLGARIEADETELRVVATGLEGDGDRLAEAIALAEELAAGDPGAAYR